MHAVVVHGDASRLVYLPPGTVHGFRALPRQGERLIALIDGWAWEQAAGASLAATSAPVGPILRELLFYLLLNPATRAFSSLVQCLIAIGGECCGRWNAGVDLDHLEGLAKDPRLRAAMAYLRDHLSEPLSIPALAEASGASVRTLRRLFAKELGLTPKEVLVRNRIGRARDLLAAGGTSVTEAALAVGYASMSQFLAVFRKTTCQLPSELGRAAAYWKEGCRALCYAQLRILVSRIST